MTAIFGSLFRPYLELKHVLVNLKSGTVFRAVIYAQRGPWLQLAQVEILADRGVKSLKPMVVDGEVLVPARDVDFVQVIR